MNCFSIIEQFLERTGKNGEQRLFIAVGELERFMVDDAKRLVERLEEAQSENLDCTFYCAPEENHASVVPTTMSRAIRFINQ
ncbi:hypothetical protein ACFPRA_15940 [Sporosarcina soli]|uniref:Uncharacterized protein n=1 Tax=Sporosarcina soli TaxID=334736 RepID=A0ABW0TLK5_9BACL